MKKIIITAVFFAVMIVAVYYIFITFRLRKVIIIGQVRHLNNLNELSGSNLIMMRTNDVEKMLLAHNRNLEQIKVTINLPNTVKIDVHVRIPIARLVNGNEKLFVDKEGMIGLWETHGNLPVIQSETVKFVMNEKADWRIIKAIDFLNIFTKQDRVVQKIKINSVNNSYIFEMSDGVEMIAAYESNPYQIATSLQIIMQRFRIEGKNVSRVNFLYDKPLLTFNGTEERFLNE